MKKFLVSLGCVILLILLLLGLIPAFFSGSSGKKILLKLANSGSSHLQVESLSLSWLGPQKLEAVHFTSPEADLTFKSLETDSSLFNLLAGKAKNTRILSPSLKISPKAAVPSTGGSSSAHVKSGKKTFVFPVRGRIEIENGALEFPAHHIKFNDIDLGLDMGKEFLLHASCKTLHGTEEGHINVDGKISSELENFQLQANIQALSVAGIEEITALFKPELAHCLTPLLGDRLNATLNMNCCGDTTGITLHADSPLMTASLETQTENGILTLKYPATATFTLTPQLLEDLQAPVTGSFAIDQVHCPIHNWKSATVEGALKLSPATVKNFTLQNTEVHFSRISEELKIDCLADLNQIKLEAHSTLIREDLQTIGTVASGEQSYSFDLKNSMDLKKGFFLTVQGEPFLFTLQGTLDLETPHLKAAFSFPKLSLQNVVFDKTGGEIRLDGKKKMVFASLHGLVKEGEKNTGSFNAELGIDHLSMDQLLNLDLSSASIHCNLQVQNGLTAVIQKLFKFKESLPLAIGPTFDLHAELKSNVHEKTLYLKGDSRELQFELPISFREKVEVKKGQLKWTLTRDAYDLVDRFLTKKEPASRPFSLFQPGTVMTRISSLSLPIKNRTDLIPSIDFNLARMAFDLKTSIDQLVFVEKTSQDRAGMYQLDLSMKKNSGGSPLQYQLNAQVSSSKADEKGTLSLKGFLDHFSDQDGTLNLSDLSTHLNATLSHCPSLLFDILYRACGGNDTPFTSLLGTRVNARIKSGIQHASGPVTVDLQSDSCQAKMDGKLSSGVLTLNEPMKVQFTLTPPLGRYLFSTSAISAKNPLTLLIGQDRFSVPLFPFDIRNLQVGTATADPGKISCQNDGTFGAVGSLLKLHLGKEKEIPLWFAPALFRIQNGILQCERTEILFANDYQIAVWGKIDLVKDRVSMTLGLTSQALKDAFGIQGLPKNYVLQIPVKGQTGKITINSSRATAKITAMIAGEQMKGKKGGTGLFGEVLGRVGQLDDDQSQVPPPKPPFPWEK